MLGCVVVGRGLVVVVASSVVVGALVASMYRTSFVVHETTAVVAKAIAIARPIFFTVVSILLQGFDMRRMNPFPR